MKERLLRIATEIQERIDSFKAAITARNAPEARALMPDVEKLGYTITTGQAEIILEALSNDIGKNFLYSRTAVTDRCFFEYKFLRWYHGFLEGAQKAYQTAHAPPRRITPQQDPYCVLRTARSYHSQNHLSFDVGFGGETHQQERQHFRELSARALSQPAFW